MIKEISGNLVALAKDAVFDIVIFGIDCQHKNLTKLAKHFPELLTRIKSGKVGDVYNLGEYIFHNYKNERYRVYAIYIQYGINCPEYAAIGLGLRGLAASLTGNEEIGMQKLGWKEGLDWDAVKKLIKIELEDFDVTIVEEKIIEYKLNIVDKL